MNEDLTKAGLRRKKNLADNLVKNLAKSKNSVIIVEQNIILDKLSKFGEPMLS